MRAQQILFIVLISLTLYGCGTGLDLGKFESEKWIEDIDGCKGDRVEQLEALEKLKPQLLGLYQKAILKVLGSPEEQELSKRSQVYYIYRIDPGPKCEGSIDNPRKLEIRFTALGIANEVNIR